MRKLISTGNRYIALKNIEENASIWKQVVNRLTVTSDQEVFESSVLLLEFDLTKNTVYLSIPSWVFDFAREAMDEFPPILAEILGLDRLSIFVGEPYPYWQVASETPCPRCGSTDILWQELPKEFNKYHSHRAVCQECDRWRGWIEKKQVEALKALKGAGGKLTYCCWTFAPRLHTEDKGWVVIHHPSYFDFGRHCSNVEPL